MIDSVINISLVVVTLVVVSVTTLYVFFTKRFRYWKDLGVPGPEPEMFYGNTKERVQFKMSPAEFHDMLYQEYKDEAYIGYYNLWQKVLLIRDFQLVKKIMENDFDHFRNRSGFTPTAETDAIFINLFSATDEAWKTRRSAFSKLFTPKKLKDYHEDMQRGLSYLMEELESVEGQDIECKEIMRTYAVRTICMELYGLDVSKDEARIAKFVEYADVFATPPFSSILKILGLSLVPSIFEVLKINIFPPGVYHFFSDITKEMMHARAEGKVDRSDLLDLVTMMTKDGIMGKEKISYGEAVGHIYSFFQASFDTTELTVCHTLLQLALHPEVQEKVRQELDLVLKGSQTITHDQLSEMNYLDAVICETLRICPPVGVLDRVCNKPYKVDDKFTIQEGTLVIIPVSSIQMEPAYFPEPEKFKPERFYNKEESHSKEAWIPFGAGPRTCIGMRLAKAGLKLVLAKILSRYMVLQSEKMMLPMKFDPKSFVFTSVPINGFWLRLKKRVL